MILWSRVLSSYAIAADVVINPEFEAGCRKRMCCRKSVVRADGWQPGSTTEFLCCSEMERDIVPNSAVGC